MFHRICLRNKTSHSLKNKIKEEFYGRVRIYQDYNSNKWKYENSDGFISSQLRSMFLPIQYPQSVHKSYLKFHIWQATETYIGAIVTVLCSQAMLVSLGLSHETASVGAVGINWILKDGIGEIGKLGFISHSARSFDSNPKTWKAIGEFLTTVGSGLQLCTAFVPSTYFLLFASTGNIAKSIALALWGATHMWFTRHFALQNNIGDLTGKAESQSAFALISGWFSGILLISYDHSSWFLLGCYLMLIPLHGVATYNLLKNAQFEILGQARATWITWAYVLGGGDKVLNVNDTMDGVGLFGEYLRKEYLQGYNSRTDTLLIPKIVLGSSMESSFNSLSDAMLCIEAIRAEDYIIGLGVQEEISKEECNLMIVLHKESEGI